MLSFANAQTGNVVLMGIEATTGDWNQEVFHALPILAFIIGVIVAEVIKKPSLHLYMPDSERAVLILETAVLFVIGFIPYNIPDIFVTVAISFVASVQVCSFRKLVDSPYNTTMITGNLRFATQEAYNAFTRRDYKSALRAILFSQ